MFSKASSCVLLAYAMMAVCWVVCTSSFEISRNLSTHTPYRPGQSYSTYTPPPDQCHAIHINFVARHGSRYPTTHWAERMDLLSQRLAAVADGIHREDLQWMKNWTNPFVPETSGWLCENGAREHFHIAKRMQAYYPPEVFNQSWSFGTYPMSSTQVPRAGRSASAFAAGMFGGKGGLGPSHADAVFINASTSPTLRFFDLCPSYQDGVKSNASASFQASAYEDAVFPRIAQALTAYVDAPGLSFTAEDVQTVWQLCGAQVAVLNVTHQWCTLFTIQHVRELQYADDVASYWIKGYGHAINYEIACPLLTSFDRAISLAVAQSSASSSTTPPPPPPQHDGSDASPPRYPLRATLRFAHAETIFPFVSLLGLFNDGKPLLANATAQQMESRVWRSNTIAPYAANVALVLYQCTSGGGTPQQRGKQEESSTSTSSSTYLVKLLHNEKEMRIPGCGTQLYCPLETFRSVYATPLSQCNFDALCNVSTSCNNTPPHNHTDDGGRGGGGDGCHLDLDSWRGFGVMLAIAMLGIILGGSAMMCCVAGIAAFAPAKLQLLVRTRGGPHHHHHHHRHRHALKDSSHRPSRYELLTDELNYDE